ncbi:Acyl-CoA N-acyltransferases (Nat) [Glarea lozoyensis ATCC 20868]|uniref:Acyl-CoA N-acyltransferases (Nat) n=1 Tax=Glarea lozoyensis (strain ATCC 20868 / MF5171) TaxID=1116229 RepID=S3DFE3_GLAL2|nr:Acyl-CoA N-acyltransferases (Nat) [Glarea lozoyensis ATCC 20868]EPE35809.1 Acyl-CoA N-acyltransferases (Nat) [Glarea lozoyensis ATCC 20868]
MEAYTILPLTPPDLDTMTHLVWLSKQSLTVNRLLYQNWPNEAAQRAQCRKAVENSMQCKDVQSWKVVHKESGEMVGHVAMKFYGDAGQKDVGGGGEVPDGMHPGVYEMVVDSMTDLWEDWGGVRHLQLTHIFILREHRAHGLGKELVRLCVEAAKDRGLALTVGSEPQVHGFFGKMEFKDFKHSEWDLERWADEFCGFGKFRVWGMAVE